jgi:hypothetical protein
MKDTALGCVDLWIGTGGAASARLIVPLTNCMKPIENTAVQRAPGFSILQAFRGEARRPGPTVGMRISAYLVCLPKNSNTSGMAPAMMVA